MVSRRFSVREVWGRRLMIVERFLEWAQTASASQRADGVSALARAYLYSCLGEHDRRAAEIALTAQLDDPSPLVRRALAESFASARQAPRHIIVALAGDQSDIAAPVLARSPLLGDADLMDCAAIGDMFAQAAIALRPNLSAPVCAALAETAGREALIALLVNLAADISEPALRRILERFGQDGETREALLARPHLPASLRSALVSATADALSAFVTGCDWMSAGRAARITREAREKAQIIIAATTDDQGPRQLARHLRQSGQLTAGLVLRALLSGNTSLFEASLSELSGVPVPRAAGYVRDWKSASFAALYARAGLPPALLPAFRAALAAMREVGTPPDAGTAARLSRAMIERVLTSCAAIKGHELDKVMALLRRFEGEAAREEAREATQALRERTRLAAVAPPGYVIDMEAIEAELVRAA